MSALSLSLLLATVAAQSVCKNISVLNRLAFASACGALVMLHDFLHNTVYWQTGSDYRCYLYINLFRPVQLKQPTMKLDTDGRERTAVNKNSFMRGTKIWRWGNTIIAGMVIGTIAVDLAVW